jgi:hypothetical protein
MSQHQPSSFSAMLASMSPRTRTLMNFAMQQVAAMTPEERATQYAELKRTPRPDPRPLSEWHGQDTPFDDRDYDGALRAALANAYRGTAETEQDAPAALPAAPDNLVSTLDAAKAALRAQYADDPAQAEEMIATLDQAATRHQAATTVRAATVPGTPRGKVEGWCRAGRLSNPFTISNILQKRSPGFTYGNEAEVEQTIAIMVETGDLVKRTRGKADCYYFGPALGGTVEIPAE